MNFSLPTKGEEVTELTSQFCLLVMLLIYVVSIFVLSEVSIEAFSDEIGSFHSFSFEISIS
jgi:hypothetical protein